MMEQLDLFSTEPTEQWVYGLLAQSLKTVIQRNNLSSKSLFLKDGKAYSSVWFDTQMVFRICCRNGSHYFGVSHAYTNCANETVLGTIIKGRSNDGFTNFEFKPNADGVRLFEEFLSAVLDMVIDSIPKQFDCCSRYEACSDAKKCIHPNPDMALACGYRKIMKKNRIYYGKNRNID